MRSTVLAYAMSGLLATTAAAAERPVTNRHTGLIEAPLAGLRRAAEHTDRAELSRWAARIGAARLARALADPDRGLVLAVLDSLPHLSDRLLLLEPILACCESADPGLSERALRTLGTILSEADPTMLEIWEVPPETIDRACRLLVSTASRAEENMGLRMAALQSLADAHALCAGRQQISRLMRDPSPEIRRAAILLASAADVPSLHEASHDPSPAVASAAAATLCRLRLSPVAHPAGPAPRPMRELAVLPETPLEDRAEMLVCLAESKDPADAEAVQIAGRAAPSALRETSKP